VDSLFTNLESGLNLANILIVPDVIVEQAVACSNMQHKLKKR